MLSGSSYDAGVLRAPFIAVRIDSAADEPDISLCVVRVAEQFQLSVDDVVVASSYRVVSLVPALIRVLDDASVQRLTGLRAVHAGIVQWGERALLIPGVTHTGKSTLVAELLRRVGQPIFPMSMR